MTKYNNVSLTDKERDDLLEIGNRVLAPYGVTVTLPAVIRYMIHQQRALHVKNDEEAYKALNSLKIDDIQPAKKFKPYPGQFNKEGDLND